MYHIIAVDISGRHRIASGYYMVCAAVSLSVTPSHVEKIRMMRIRPFLIPHPPEVGDIVRIVLKTVSGMDPDATIIIEQGDMFNQPEQLSMSMFPQPFKYQESLSERLGIEIAHHVSLNARNLLLKELDISD